MDHATRNNLTGRGGGPTPPPPLTYPSSQYTQKNKKPKNDLNTLSELALSNKQHLENVKDAYVSLNAQKHGVLLFKGLLGKEPENQKKSLKGILISTRGELVLGAAVVIGIAAFSLIQWMIGVHEMKKDRTATPGYHEVVKR